MGAEEVSRAVRDLCGDELGPTVWGPRQKSGIADAQAIKEQLGVSLDDAKAIADAARDSYESMSHAARDDAISALREWLPRNKVEHPAGATVDQVGDEIGKLLSRPQATAGLRRILSQRFGLDARSAHVIADALVEREPQQQLPGHSGWRDADAEAKLVAQIRETLHAMVRKAASEGRYATDEDRALAEARIREALTGTVAIAADQQMCDSCRQLVTHLQAEFPGLRLIADGAEHTRLRIPAPPPPPPPPPPNPVVQLPLWPPSG
jgi:hypothetical protein